MKLPKNPKYTRGAAGGDFILFIFFLIVLGIVWGLTGGPERPISLKGPFLNPPFPLGDGTAYSVPGVNIPSVTDREVQYRDTDDRQSIGDIIARIRGGDSSEKGTSPYAGLVSLSRAGARNTDPNDEYITLKTNGDVRGRITISDWRIESAISFSGTTLGGATYLPNSGSVNTESPIAIGKDTTIYIITGRSPIGSSFRINTCTGYFAQFQDFTPKLKNECPLPEDELKRTVGADFIPNDECIEYVGDIRRCIFTLESIPEKVGDACRNFILETLTYNGCIKAHKNNPDFYKDVWHVYLDRDQELWEKSSERIRLLDENGLVVDTLNY